MAYTDHYHLADDVITHLNIVIPGILDPFLVSRYVGFVAVAAVTVYELAIKDIFIEFTEKKHKVFGEYTRNKFERINGRIKTSTIKDDYISPYGKKYTQRFSNKINEMEKITLVSRGISMLSSYGNLIVWRNQFAHEGTLPSTATYPEVVGAYQIGKDVIRCLAETMTR